MTKWTTEDMPDQAGKIAVVTGGNSGIGFEAALRLAAKGAQVIIAARSLERGEAAAQEIRGEAPQGSVAVMHLDLADLASVKRFAADFTARYDQLHLLINNAGVMALPERRQTADGFEMQFGTNHLGHFALTGLLLDTLRRTPGARVVTVSSGAHRFGRINFDNLNSENSYQRWLAYGTSKLANLLFTYELQRRFEAAGAQTIAVAAHPGYTATNLQRHTGLFTFLNKIFAQPQEMGGLPTLYAATMPDVQGGEYFGPDGPSERRGYPTRVTSVPRSYDAEVARKLWAVSEDLTGVSYNGV